MRFAAVAAVMISGVIFRLEGLAYRKGWLEEPHRAMPKTLGTVVPFGPRPSSFPSRSKAE